MRVSLSGPIEHTDRPDGRNDFCGFESHLTSMAQAGDFCPEESTMAVGSRRSWEAAFGDNTIDETTSFAGRGYAEAVDGIVTAGKRRVEDDEA